MSVRSSGSTSETTIGGDRPVFFVCVRDGRRGAGSDELGGMMLPSVVGVGRPGDWVGEAARNQFILYPERTVDHQTPVGQRRKGRARTRVTPARDLRHILKRLQEIAAERAPGRPVRKAVITAAGPIFDTQRQADPRGRAEIVGSRSCDHQRAHGGGDASRGDETQGKASCEDPGGGTFEASIREDRIGLCSRVHCEAWQKSYRRPMTSTTRSRACARSPQDQARVDISDSAQARQGFCAQRRQPRRQRRSSLRPHCGGIPRRERGKAGPPVA